MGASMLLHVCCIVMRGSKCRTGDIHELLLKHEFVMSCLEWLSCRYCMASQVNILCLLQGNKLPVSVVTPCTGTSKGLSWADWMAAIQNAQQTRGSSVACVESYCSPRALDRGQCPVGRYAFRWACALQSFNECSF